MTKSNRIQNMKILARPYQKEISPFSGVKQSCQPKKDMLTALGLNTW